MKQTKHWLKKNFSQQTINKVSINQLKFKLDLNGNQLNPKFEGKKGEINIEDEVKNLIILSR